MGTAEPYKDRLAGHGAARLNSLCGVSYSCESILLECHNPQENRAELWERKEPMTFQRRFLRTLSLSALLISIWLGSCFAGELVDLNSATPEQLKNLPGMTEGYIMMIVGARPFQSKEDLVEQKLLPQSTYDQMKDRIFVKGGSVKSSPPTAVPIPPPSARSGAESGDREGSEMVSPSVASPSHVCIKEERSKERMCGELIR